MSVKTQQEGAKELVERARANDQNAMATLVMVGQNARAGNPVAKSAYKHVMDYINANPAGPVKTKYGIGAETQAALSQIPQVQDKPENLMEILCSLPLIGDSLAIQGACIILANGSLWTKEKVDDIKKALAEPAQKLFNYGYCFSSDSNKIRPVAQKVPQSAIGYLCAGHCIGTARKIQLLRGSETPIAMISPDIGWELSPAGRLNGDVSRPT
jgi:hypothetical protein